MLHLHEIAAESFVLLQAEWPVRKALELVTHLERTHVIVHRLEPTDFYYLYPREEALACLRNTDPDVTIHQAFNLHEGDATPALDAYSDAREAPDRTVVLDEGRVVGFYDIDLPPSQQIGSGRRGDGKASETAAPAVRSMVVDFPQRVPLYQTLPLLVYLSAQAEGGPALPVAVPVGSEVKVTVACRAGFESVGPVEGSLVVVDEDETLPLNFTVRATEPGPGRIDVIAYRGVQPLGRLVLRPTVAPASDPRRAAEAHESPLAPLTVRQPDLSLLILESRIGGEIALTMRLSATDSSLGLNFKPFGPVPFRTSPVGYLREFFQGIDALPIGSAGERAIAERKLQAKGTHLFKTLFPKDLQALLWSLKERIKTVQIQSEEPWVPWELCRLQGEEGGQIVHGPYMCEAFEVTRWLPGLPLQLEITLKNLGLVVPKRSGLRYVRRERDYLLSLANGERRVNPVPARYLDVVKELDSGSYDGWHFSGHGRARSPDPNRSAMVLEAGDELIPEDLSMASSVRNARPLVFLNACQIGQSAMSLTDIGGWAAQFLRAGAVAFIGAYWSILDDTAYEFCQAFYGRLLSGVPIGRAVREARLAVKSAQDLTWLAYTVYAHPLATVQ